MPVYSSLQLNKLQLLNSECCKFLFLQNANFEKLSHDGQLSIFLCFCLLGLAVQLNFDISKEAFCTLNHVTIQAIIDRFQGGIERFYDTQVGPEKVAWP